MFDLIPALLAALRVFFSSRLDTSLEVLALRQQVAALRPKRPRPQLSEDWERIYGHSICFQETFTDPERFRG